MARWSYDVPAVDGFYWVQYKDQKSIDLVGLWRADGEVYWYEIDGRPNPHPDISVLEQEGSWRRFWDTQRAWACPPELCRWCPALAEQPPLGEAWGDSSTDGDVQAICRRIDAEVSKIEAAKAAIQKAQRELIEPLSAALHSMRGQDLTEEDRQLLRRLEALSGATYPKGAI